MTNEAREERDREREHLMERLRAVAAQLMEHCDSVQIFATKQHADGTTAGVAHGDGNWYARVGQASEWLEQDRERIRENIRRENE